jgi:hypothetical protein
MRNNRHALCWIAFIEMFYLASFLLPVYRFTDYRMGWEVFWDATTAMFEQHESPLNTLVGITLWAPNPALWVGVICLWAGRPFLALLTGGFAAAIAGFILFDVRYLSWPEDLQALIDRSGAYVWSVSMVLLAVAGLVFSIQQWRRTRRLPMLGEK